MHKSSLRAGSGGMTVGVGMAVLRPPKPPCWRDFVSPEPSRKDHFSHSSAFIQPDVRSITDLSGGVGLDATDSFSLTGYRLSSQLHLPGSSSKASRPSKRVRARIHRTRSEHLIDVEALPEGELTVNLADTRPHELRRHARPAAEVDDRLYAEENNRRCQSWLASIEAAEPLDDIGYSHSKDKEVVGLEGVDVEVPEETFSWIEEERDREAEQDLLKPPINTSSSGSDADDLLQHVMAAVGLAASGDDASEDEDEISKQAPLRRGRGSSGQGGHVGLRSTSSSLNVHKKLSSKHILTISEQSGLE